MNWHYVLILIVSISFVGSLATYANAFYNYIIDGLPVKKSARISMYLMFSIFILSLILIVGSVK